MPMQFTHVWTGKGDGKSLNDPRNWDVGSVPGKDACVLIGPDAVVECNRNDSIGPGSVVTCDPRDGVRKV